jgi:hypothetical protein
MCNYALFSLFLFPHSLFSCLPHTSNAYNHFWPIFFNVFLRFVSFFYKYLFHFVFLPFINLVQPVHMITSLILSVSPIHLQGSISLISSSRSVRSSRNAKKREPGSKVTCFRCGLVQTVKSFKWHFPQCLGSSSLRTSVSNDTLVPPINPDKRDCDPMVDDLSKPDFVRRHLPVESQNFLACYDYDNDDDSDQSSVK